MEEALAEVQAEVLAEEDRMAGVVVLPRPARKNTSLLSKYMDLLQHMLHTLQSRKH